MAHSISGGVGVGLCSSVHSSQPASFAPASTKHLHVAQGDHASPRCVATRAVSESIAVATVLGAGVLALASRRQRKQKSTPSTEGAQKAVVVENVAKVTKLEDGAKAKSVEDVAKTKKVEDGAKAKNVEHVAKTKKVEDVASFFDVVKQTGRENEATAVDRVFHWLGRSPQIGSPSFTSLQKYFPGALPSQAVHMRSKLVLEEDFGFTPETTLLGSSFCPDEINNQEKDLATLMRNHYGKIFPMGGIGGAPYVGQTGFYAFSSHVADNGDIIVIFGPHVGISESGEVGKHLRAGQKGLSTACGAVIGAYNACLCAAPSSEPEMDEADMQMSEILKEFAPHVVALSQSENPMAACAYQAYKFVLDRIEKIVNTKFGSGRLVLIGGIQINMPEASMEDQFLPMMFEVRQEGKPSQDLLPRFKDVSIMQDLRRSPWAAVSAQREVFAYMSWSPPVVSPMYKTMHKYFPGALPSQAVHNRAIEVLSRYGFTNENTLLGTSVCPDEINNEPADLPVLMQEFWGEVFPMGGISGAPFSGKTGFKAFSSHVADTGHILLMFGPHVGISATGEVGKCVRTGQPGESTACGAIIGAYKACMSGDMQSSDSLGYDMQMDFIKRQIAPHAKAISKTESPMAALAHQSYSMVKDQMFTVVNTNFGSGYLCLIGGIQINLPDPVEDHFYPCTFELRRAGEPTIDLLQEMREFS